MYNIFVKNKNFLSYITIIAFFVFIFFIHRQHTEVNNGITNTEANTKEVAVGTLSEQEKQKIIDFISETDNYKKNGENIFLGSGYGEVAYDAGTYCHGCRYVMANYSDKSDKNISYDLDLLINNEKVISILNTEKQSREKSDQLSKEFNSSRLIKRGQTLHGLTLDSNGYIKYGNHVLPAKIEGSDYNKLDKNGSPLLKTITDFDSILVFNFERYNKVYFLARADQYNDAVVDCSAEYVFNKNDNSLLDLGCSKYFSPVKVFGYSPNERYLALEVQQDDLIGLAIFDIKENKYINIQGFTDGGDIYDFHFIDNTKYTYKYKTPYSYANQEQTASGSIESVAN